MLQIVIPFSEPTAADAAGAGRRVHDIPCGGFGGAAGLVCKSSLLGYENQKVTAPQGNRLSPQGMFIKQIFIDEWFNV